jgi:hypothetical protein
MVTELTQADAEVGRNKKVIGYTGRFESVWLIAAMEA